MSGRGWSDEAPAHPHWKARVTGARETDTYYSSLFDIGWPDAPHRTLRNQTIDDWLAAGAKIPTPPEVSP